MDKENVRMEMQLTEEQFVADWKKHMGLFHPICTTSVVRYLNLRAQADARPVARFHLDEAELDALYEAIEWAKDEGLPGTAEHLQAIFDAHDHEASAPGLSDEQILQIADECGPGGKENRYSDPWHAEHYIAFARSVLTRASAAPLSRESSVAEPIEQFEHLDLQNHQLRRAMQKMMARLTELLDEDKFAEVEAIAKSAGVEPPAAQQQAEPGADERAALTWYEGEPPFPQREEWFIAETIHGERVVLRALPEEYPYEYTTADQTYMKAQNVKRWMQFPDCEFVPPKAAQSGQRAGVAEDVRDAARYRWLRHADLDALAAANWGEGEVYEGEAFDAAIDSAMLAVAPTQQQEGGK